MSPESLEACRRPTRRPAGGSRELDDSPGSTFGCAPGEHYMQHNLLAGAGKRTKCSPATHPATHPTTTKQQQQNNNNKFLSDPDPQGARARNIVRSGASPPHSDFVPPEGPGPAAVAVQAEQDEVELDEEEMAEKMILASSKCTLLMNHPTSKMGMFSTDGTVKTSLFAPAEIEPSDAFVAQVSEPRPVLSSNVLCLLLFIYTIYKKQKTIYIIEILYKKYYI